MTREEAIKIFKGFKFLPREMKAVDMAIKALEQEPIIDKVKQAREEIEHLSKYGKETYYMAIDDVLAILDKLIESEVKE